MQSKSDTSHASVRVTVQVALPDMTWGQFHQTHFHRSQILEHMVCTSSALFFINSLHVMCIPCAHQVHSLYTLVQILLCSSHFPLPCIRFRKFVQWNLFDETGPWSVRVAEMEDKSFLLADVSYHNFGSLLPSVIISCWRDTYIPRMKVLVLLNKFIIHGALISISWFWYHRMVYMYNMHPMSWE